MQKMFHALCVVMAVLFSGSIGGMETGSVSKLSEQESAWNAMSFHDRVIYRIKNGTQNFRGMFGATPLWVACYLGYLEDIKLLLDAHAKVNVKTYAGVTPLHVASQNGYIEAVKLLLAAGADIYWKDCRDETPLQLAQQKGHAEIVMLLQEELQRDVVVRKKARLAKRKTW